MRRWGDHRLWRIRKRKRRRPYREYEKRLSRHRSEGFIRVPGQKFHVVPFEFEGQHNPGRGKEPCFVRATEEPRVRGLPPCCSPREVTRKLQRKLCAKAKQDRLLIRTRWLLVRRCGILSRANKHRSEKCACLGVKNIGKPYALIAHVRFDEGGQAMWTMARLLRHRQTKGAATDMLGLRNTVACSLLYLRNKRTDLRDGAPNDFTTTVSFIF